MNLSGGSFKQLHEALLDAFSPSELSIFVRIGMGTDLEEIPSREVGLRKQVAELIKWAESCERIEELLEKAREANPSNSKLADVQLEFLEEAEEAADLIGTEESERSRQSVITDSVIAGGDVNQRIGGIDFGSGDMHITGPVAGREINIEKQYVIQAAEAKGPPMEIPRRAQHFHGREDLIKEVMREIYPGRVVTLYGIGGIGKTAVVAEVVGKLQESGQLLERFPDGVIFHSFIGEED